MRQEGCCAASAGVGGPGAGPGAWGSWGRGAGAGRRGADAGLAATCWCTLPARPGQSITITNVNGLLVYDHI